MLKIKGLFVVMVLMAMCVIPLASALSECKGIVNERDNRKEKLNFVPHSRARRNRYFIPETRHYNKPGKGADNLSHSR